MLRISSPFSLPEGPANVYHAEAAALGKREERFLASLEMTRAKKRTGEF
jgi:hypothetical protein